MSHLAEIQARLDAAWRGHDWAVVGDSVAEVYYPDVLQPIAENVHPVDATFIANAPTDIAYLLERVRMWKALAEEAIEEFEDARGYASAYFTGKWGYDVTSAQFAERRAALTEGESNE